MVSTPTRPDADVAVLLESVVERVCRDLKGRVARGHVRHVAMELMARYPTPTVTTYIPIILSRRVREQLERRDERST